jgi:SagB-type dehydrogenase family enzyme
MLLYEDAYSLAALYHLNSEPWNNLEAYNDPHARLNESKKIGASEDAIALPEAAPSPLMKLIAARQSCRDFAPTELQVGDLAAVLDAGYGITGVRSFPDGMRVFARTTPSAGGLYPLELYVLTERTSSVPPGLYHFNVRDHLLEPLFRTSSISDLLPDLMQQHYLANAAALVFLTAVFPRALRKYGPRGYRYVLLEAGHAVQNICLRAAELGLGALCTGGYTDSRINAVLQLHPQNEGTIYIVALGRPAVEEGGGLSSQYAEIGHNRRVVNTN